MRTVELSRGKQAVVDDDDFSFVSQWKWYAQKSKTGSFYAVRMLRVGPKKDGFKMILMHRLLLGAPEGSFVDHIDGNPLNNRRENIRICSVSQNGMNRKLGSNSSSGLKGAQWVGSRKKWRSLITIGKKQKYLGIFSSPDLAHEAYKRAALELFGEFARNA